MVDIASSADIASEGARPAAAASGVGTFENTATQRRVDEDSLVERAEVEGSDTADGVGDSVDINA